MGDSLFGQYYYEGGRSDFAIGYDCGGASGDGRSSFGRIRVDCDLDFVAGDPGLTFADRALSHLLIMAYLYRQIIKKLAIYPALRAELDFPADKRKLFLLWIERLIILDVLLFTLTAQGFWVSFEESLAGVGLLLMVVWVGIYLVELFVNYYERNRSEMDWLLALVLFSVEGKDLAGGFMNTLVGRRIARRAEIGDNELELFLKARRSVPIGETDLAKNNFKSVSDLFSFLLSGNPDLENLFLKKGLNKTEAVKVVQWEELSFYNRLRTKEWWHRDRLARLPGLAKDWSFGKTFLLKKYGRNLSEDDEVSGTGRGLSVWTETVERIEIILAKNEEPNVVLVGESSAGSVEPLWLLAKQIKDGTVPPVLESKKIFVLSTSYLLADFPGLADLENALLEIVSEAVKAGNLILVVDNFPILVSALRERGGDLGSLWGGVISGRGIQIIGLAEKNSFHNVLASENSLMDRFETVSVQEISVGGLVNRMLSEVEKTEKENEILFSYQAIVEVVKSAEAFFSEGDIVDEARDLLVEIIPWLSDKKIDFVDKTIIKNFVGQKTGVPLQAIDQAEKEKLINLEDRLAERVIGQKESLKALAGAFRRGRAGTRNTNRPIGSFLFFGPTGVGKTETAKALAQVLFGDEKELVRLDMSEFSGPEAMERLTGSASGRAGILSKLVKEHPYGVLLLDEFEKTDPEVLNLFLQIFDEGFFSDADGQKLILRNMLIIATSNAGADQIWDLVRSGADLSASKDVIVDSLVKRGLFRPELLNRFDATVLYSPLSQSELVKIAQLQLNSLAKRLLSQGLKLNISDNLAETVAQAGQSKEFGARPLARFIQDRIEEPIATKIIEGVASPGSILEFDENLNLKVKTL